MIGAKFLDDLYRGAWKGGRISRTQTLAWPRYGVVDEEGLWITNTEIPQELKDANCEAAVLSISSETLYPVIEPKGPVRRIEIDKGIMKEWFKDTSGIRESWFTTITRLLKGLTVASPGSNIMNVPKLRG